MFDVGFSEILVVFVVALIVLGPEKLPATARTLGLWWGRIRYQINAAKRDFEREIGADDIRRQLHNEQIMRELGESKEAIQRMMREGEQFARSPLSNITPTGEAARKPLAGEAPKITSESAKADHKP
jgi:sec-independent protein translocase protein TatB